MEFTVMECVLLAMFLFISVKPAYEQPVPVGSVDNSNPTLGSSQGTTASPSVTKPNAGTADDLDQIKNNMVGGVTAVRDSIIGLIAFLVGGAKRVVEDQVQAVVDVGQRVVDKTVQVKDTFQKSGSAIAQTFGETFRQTGNITSQLVHSLASNEPVQGAGR